MSDRVFATIEILKSDIRRYPELAEAVKAEFFDLPKEVSLNIDKHEPCDRDNWDNSSIAYFKDEYSGGYFDVEDICKALHVPYDHWNEGACGYDEATVHYRPDINATEEIICGTSGDREFTESELRKLVVYSQGDASSVIKIDVKDTGKNFLAFLYKAAGNSSAGRIRRLSA